MVPLQTVLPFKLAVTDESLTAHGGLALFGEYLDAMGVGALVGIERQITPPDPVTGNAYLVKLKGLPPDWASAINAFAVGDIVEATMPIMLRDMLVACKRREMATFAGQVTDFEYETYLDMV